MWREKGRNFCFLWVLQFSFYSFLNIYFETKMFRDSTFSEQVGKFHVMKEIKEHSF